MHTALVGWINSKLSADRTIDLLAEMFTYKSFISKLTGKIKLKS